MIDVYIICLYTFISEDKPSNYYTNELYVRRIRKSGDT
jgi:hypothetical protein